MSKYISNYRSPRDYDNEFVALEEAAQKLVAENPEWLLATRLSRLGKQRFEGDSAKEIEALGFKVLSAFNDLFYKVIQPEGWQKETRGYWTIIKDKEGKERITQFFKGAPYDTDAFLNIKKDS